MNCPFLPKYFAVESVPAELLPPVTNERPSASAAEQVPSLDPDAEI